MARWCAEQPEVEMVLHPALPDCPGHGLWERDFTGLASVFSVVIAEPISPEEIVRPGNRLTPFQIGYGRGGVTGLAMPHFDLPGRYRPCESRLAQFNRGLEAAGGLHADLERGFITLSAWSSLPAHSEVSC